MESRDVSCGIEVSNVDAFSELDVNDVHLNIELGGSVCQMGEELEVCSAINSHVLRLLAYYKVGVLNCGAEP